MNVDKNADNNQSTSSSNSQAVAKPKREYDPTDNQYRGYKYFWEVYPAEWTKSMGNKPLLGYVRADSEFNAYYAAWDKGFAYLWNFPFGIDVNKATKFIKSI